MLNYHSPNVENEFMSIALEMWRDGLTYSDIVHTFQNTGMPKATAEYFAICTVPLSSSTHSGPAQSIVDVP